MSSDLLYIFSAMENPDQWTVPKLGVNNEFHNDAPFLTHTHTHTQLVERFIIFISIAVFKMGIA